MKFDKAKLAAAKNTVFGRRITVHPAIANAYCTLYLTHGIMSALQDKKQINYDEYSDNRLPASMGEQALMKALFLELMDLANKPETPSADQTLFINDLFNKYYHLRFIQNFIMRADSNSDRSPSDPRSLETWFIQNLNDMGLLFDEISSQPPKEYLFKSFAALSILKHAMKHVLSNSANQDLLKSPSWAWVAIKMTVGIFLLSITLSVLPHIMAGHGLLMLFVGAYGAYLMKQSISAIRAPAFEPNLSSQPDACRKQTLVINKESIDVAPQSLVTLSYGTHGKSHPPQSTLAIVANKFRQIFS